jgi:uncharacterized alpha-E superfamily protein
MTLVNLRRDDLKLPSRPMLARDADSMYWMSRYVERSEHIARLLLVTGNLLTDTGDLAPQMQQRQWMGIVEILRNSDPPAGDAPLGERVIRHLTFSQENPGSLINCIARARENARGIRESISAEMWENLNALYWAIFSEEARGRFDESTDEFYRSIMTGSMLFQGITDQTMAHDQRWLFTQIGKYFERIDVTARVIETKFNILRAAERALETPLRNINWMAVLRSCCSIEAYRRHHIGDMDPMLVASFLILQRDFPRSIRFCLEQAHLCMAQIRQGSKPDAIDPAERILGRMTAQIEYAEMNEILERGLPGYLQQIQSGIGEAGVAVQKSYFLM